MKKHVKILSIWILFSIMLLSNSVFAANDFGSWWNGASDWYQNGSTNVAVDQGVLSGISNLVEVIGTAVIAIVTVVLGMKYMLSSAAGKSEVKENLTGLIVACTFFFGWSSIRDLLIAGSSTGANGLSGNSTYLVFFQEGDLTSTLAQIFSFILLIAKLVSVVVIAYNGVKYILAGADAKAQLKQRMPVMIIGVILVFCTITFLEFIANTITTSFNTI